MYTTYVRIDLDAIAQNIRTLDAHSGPAEVMAVVKDDAYGHGAVPIARTALQAGATRLAVGRTDEGIQLREAGITAPILNLCYAIEEEMTASVTHDLTVAVGSLHMAQQVSKAAAQQGKTVTVHVKVDTGMGRYGFLPDEVVPFLKEASRLPHLDFEGIFTHFAVADSADKGYTRCQFESFEMVLAACAEVGFTFRVRHCANSAATIDLPQYALDAVRPGIAIYGLPPSPEVSTGLGLRPALSLHSHVARVKRLPEGSGLGYGLTYTTPTEATIALVPVGYGDGYHRILSNNADVLIDGRRAPIRGRVCMDQFMVEVEGQVNEGDPVVLIGQQGAESISAGELAQRAQTINYEVVTGLSRRIPRIYVQGGEVVEVLRIV